MECAEFPPGQVTAEMYLSCGQAQLPKTSIAGKKTRNQVCHPLLAKGGNEGTRTGTFTNQREDGEVGGEEQTLPSYDGTWHLR